MVAAFTTMKGPFSRRELRWMSRAASSLPDPAGPEIITLEFVGATFSIEARNAEAA